MFVTTDEGMAAMAARSVFAVLLPTTAYVLRIAPPPARKLISAGTLGMLWVRLSAHFSRTLATHTRWAFRNGEDAIAIAVCAV